ncbi:hypothetical protein [Bacillus atrophaeus]|uniref:hypothetical protein n=1 Tax=Bacillus atrophaeus TaxID=1452 RepID=UPI000AC4AE6B|nr:hypothetical protein [Bacillus atrophaeus]MED4806304.1 hypothetical protein [Bacillus atrophaeus]
MPGDMQLREEIDAWLPEAPAAAECEIRMYPEIRKRGAAALVMWQLKEEIDAWHCESELFDHKKEPGAAGSH